MPLYNKKDKEMVKVINIDTKTRTIRVENAADGDIKTWRTTESGAHFPIKKGESTKEALDKFVEKKQEESPAMRAAREASDRMNSLKLAIGDKKNGVKKESGLLGDRYDAKHGTKPEKSDAPLLGDREVKDVTDWPKSPKFEKLTEQYMPKQGEADTELGEILRSINQVVYRYYNDGDMWNKGYGKETVNGAIKHLTELSKNKETPRHIARGLDNALFELKKYGVKDKDRYETALKIMMQTMEWADEKDIEALSQMKRNTEKQQQTPQKETKSSKFDSRALDRKLVRGGLSDNEIDDLAKMQDYYDISDETINAAIDAGEYSVKEIFKRLRNYDDDFATHLSDFREDYQKATEQPKQSSQPTSYDLDDAFDEADLGSEWGRAKHRMDFHGVSQYTIKDIIDSGKYEAGDIIEALQSSSHDKIDEMRKSLKK